MPDDRKRRSLKIEPEFPMDTQYSDVLRVLNAIDRKLADVAQLLETRLPVAPAAIPEPRGVIR